MARHAARRRLATVLFLDIVGSTALASELGDARWRELPEHERGHHHRDAAGVSAGGIAADVPSGAIWVGNSGKAPPPTN